MTINKRLTEKVFDEWRQKLVVITCLNGQFTNDHFCLHDFCFSVCYHNRENLINECQDNKESFLGQTDIQGVGHSVSGLPKCLRELAFTPAPHEGSLKCQSLEFESEP